MNGKRNSYLLRAIITTGLFLSLWAVTGCKKTEPAPSGQADLSQAGDLFTNPAKNVSAIPSDTPIAKINGKTITRGDLDAELARMLEMASRRLPPERLEQMKPRLAQQALDGLLLKTLLLQAVEEEQIVLTDEEMAEAKDKFLKSLPEGMTLENVLQMSNWSPEEFEQNLRTDLAINKLLEKHVEDVAAPSDKELQEYYDKNPERFEQPESVHARHILIATAQTDTEETKASKKAKAEEVREKLVAGGDFAELAKEYSDCPSKNRGGDLGTFYRGQMVQQFEEAAFAQKTNEIGPIVETPFGFHIIQVLEHADAHKVALDEVKERLSQGLQSQKRQKAAQDYVLQLKNKATIEFLDPSLRPPELTAPIEQPEQQPSE
jgi:peptidyl-prolyl cis-trans isomerase C